VLAALLTAGFITAGSYAYLTFRSSESMLWQNGLIAGSCLLALVSVGHFLYQLKPGWLDWNGVAWHWVAVEHAHDTSAQRAAVAGIVAQADQNSSLSIRFDGQSCMLVHLSKPTAAARWLWLEQAIAPEHWHDVRRAVYSRANTPVFNA
jgi:hypothetical protein